MKEKIFEIINKHNKIIEAIESLDLKLSLGDFLRFQSISCAISSEGLEITQLARANGIDAKCNMQSGLITVYGDLKE